MKLKARASVLVISCLFLTSQPSSGSRSFRAPKVLDDLLTFHSGWVSRTVTSHDPSGGNGDGDGFGNPVEGPYKVLFHAKGEGRINRIWMTADLKDDHPKKHWQDLWIIIDAKTVFRGSAVDFFSSRGPWKTPLVLDSNQASGGFLSYVPFAYHHEAKILLLGTPHYYQVTYQQGPGSSSGPTAEETSAFLSDKWWGRVPSANAVTVTLAPHQRFKIAEGTKLLTQLAVTPKDLYALEDLKVVINGQPAIPIGFFFGLAVTKGHDEEFGWADVKSAIHFVDPKTHLMMTRLPIPLQPNDSISIENQGTRTGEVSLAYDESAAPFPSEVRLNAAYAERWAPGSATSMNFFESAKSLHFVGLVEEITGGRSDNAYLEGDEIVRTDKMEYPSILGTGTEDYFNGGWYFLGPHTNPTSGEPRYFDEWGSPEHSLYRNHVLDPIVSRRYFRFGFEAGEVGAYKPVHYATLALAYEFGDTHVVGLAQNKSKALDYRVTKRKEKLVLDAEFGELPREVTVSMNRGVSHLAFKCPAAYFKNLQLTRTYDAQENNQEAEIRIAGKKVGSFFESYANPVRRLAQCAEIIEATNADCANGVIYIDIVNRHALGFSEINYEAVFLK